MMHDLVSQLRDLAPWHFDVELGEGIRTVDGNQARYGGKEEWPIAVINPSELAPLLKRIYPDGLGGKRFLDVACNGGGYSILAKRLGARFVLGFDAREHWIFQATFLVRELGLEGIEFRRADLHSFGGGEAFDICLFKGILYHLPDPVAGLRQVADLTREVIIVDSETDGERGELCLRLNKEGVGSLMTGIHGLAWWPSGPDLIAVILGWLGFTQTREIFWQPTRAPGRRRPGRCRIIGARSADFLIHFDRSASRPRPTQRKSPG
jgi:SAM-dependent methyltransferase